MIIPKGLTEGFDTRGLPFEYDPRNFYEYQFEKLRENPSSNLEWFLYRYIPHSLIKSFAFAIDPLSNFKVAPGVITPANRTKYRATASVLDIRRLVSVTYNTSYQQLVNYQGVGGCRSVFVNAVTPHFLTFTNGMNRQQPLPSTLEDTTSRTRLMGSSQGTLKKFSGFTHSPPREAIRYDDFRQIPNESTTPSTDQCIIRGGTYQVSSHGRNETRRSIEGAGGLLPVLTYSQRKLAEFAYCDQLIADNILGMLKGWSPNKRGYTLFRNIVELRDIPRSISSLKSSLEQLRTLYVSLAKSPSLREIIFNLGGAAKAVPNEYLSFHFGWKQLYKDITDLLEFPEKHSKRMNFLIARNGKPTTFRSKRSFTSGESGVSGFEYEAFDIEQNIVTTSRIMRESELRLVINATFDFPQISAPSFRRKEFFRRMGVIPTPTDLYNLVPWTWLLDWFSGLGNYIEVIDTINSDPTLINWGLITCETKGNLITSRYSRTRCTENITFNGSTQVLESYKEYRHTSNLDFECQIRKDVSKALSVRQTSDPVSLSAFQKSILGALLAQRVDFSRSTTFRPRS